jgi:hypothetical protein
MRTTKKLRGLVVALAVGVLPLVLAGALAVASSPNWVGVAQTVIVGTESNGKVKGKPKVFTQFSANGSGPHTLKVPMSASGFRNLSGLGKPPIKDGYAVWDLHLNGPTAQRAVADFPTDKLPLQVSAVYELNGKQMTAKKIDGKSGLLKVTYVITNVTTADTTVTFKNILGAEERKTVKAPVPIAAILNVTIPPAFTRVEAPGAGTSGTGNGSSTASWTLFLFDPLGGVKQSVTYQAHVTDVAVPSATLEAQALPQTNVKPLPTIPVPGAPAVPTVTLGGHLASLQTRFQAKLRQLSAKAGAVLSNLQKIGVRDARTVSGKAAELAESVPGVSLAAESASRIAGRTATKLTEDAANASENASRMGRLAADLGEAAAQAGEHVSSVHEARLKLEALRPLVKRTPLYAALLGRLVALEARLSTHVARLEARAADAKNLEGRLLAHGTRLKERSAGAKELESSAATASTKLTEKVDSAASTLSSEATKTANTLAEANLEPTRKKSPKAIKTKQVGGGAKLDAAVAQLDAAITGTASEVDDKYAYLTALDKRAAESKLPAGNAIGATTQAGAFVYSISGANETEHEVHLASFIGGFALTLGIMFGISLYRIRRGLPSSLAPPKTSTAPAEG